MDVTDQPIAASELAEMQPAPDMTELPEPARNTDVQMATKQELSFLAQQVDRLSDAIMGMSGQLSRAHSDIGQFEAFQRDFSAFIEFNNLKMPPVSGERTKFAGGR